MVVRGAKRKGTRYFGPYGQADAIRDTLDLLLRSFPIRNCSDVKFRRQAAIGRPCLQYHIERCSGPCVGAVTPEDYGQYVADLMSFLQGKTEPVIDRLEASMTKAADDLEFELAAHYRDQIESAKLASARQEMLAINDEDIDIVGVADDELGAAVQVLHIRRGRVTGRQGFVLEKDEAHRRGDLITEGAGAALCGEPPRGASRGLVADDADGCRDLRRMVERSSRWQSNALGADARSKKHRPPRVGDAQRRRAPRSASDASSCRPVVASQGPRRAAALPRAGGVATSYRVLRHGPPVRHRLRQLDEW